MLARARLGDDALLAQPLGQQCLPHRVVDLVRARVRQLLAVYRRIRRKWHPSDRPLTKHKHTSTLRYALKHSPLEPDLRPADLLRQALGEVHGRRAPNVLLAEEGHLLLEGRVLERRVVRLNFFGGVGVGRVRWLVGLFLSGSALHLSCPSIITTMHAQLMLTSSSCLCASTSVSGMYRPPNCPKCRPVTSASSSAAAPC